MTPSPWQQFFDRFAPRYDEMIFTQNTAAEIEFILEHTHTPAGGAILDLGCGTGRHSVPLATRGFRLTGVDLSDGMLTVARQRAATAGVEIEFVQSDAADFVRPAAFDTALCLCEGAFCLFCKDDEGLRRDERILHNIAASLRPGGTLILNALSALRIIRAATAESVADGAFDPTTMSERSDVQGVMPDFTPTSELRERFYTAPELRRLAEHAGLTVQGIHGGTAGNWALRPVTLDEYELMLIARKA